MKFLIVDSAIRDFIALKNRIQTVHRYANAQILHAANTGVATAVARAEAPDYILLNLQSLTRKNVRDIAGLHGLYPTVPIVAVIDWDPDNLESAAIGAGADDCV